MKKDRSVLKRMVVRRTEVERSRLLKRYDGSGLTQREFCQENKIALATFTLWLRQERRRSRKGLEVEGKQKLMPVKIIGPTMDSGLVEIVLANGRVMRVDSRMDGDHLLGLVVTLERLC